MKTEFLKGLGLTDEQISAVMAENGKDIGKEQDKTQKAITERDAYKQQAEDAQKEIQGYKNMDIEGIKTAAANWETKYNEDIKKLQDQIAQQEYDRELEKFVDKYQFTSELAKKAVIMEIKAQGFKLNDGKLLGAEDFMKQLKEANPTAFTEDGSKPPTISVPGGNNPPVITTKEEFKKMSYAERMKIFTENRELYNQLSK